MCVCVHVYVSICLVKYSIHLHIIILFCIITVCVEACVYIHDCVHMELTTYITVLSSLDGVLNHTLIVLLAAMLTRSLL